MKYENMSYIKVLGLVVGTIFGIIFGMTFIWLALIEKWHFGYFVTGFIMIIIGMFSICILLDYSAWKEDKIYGVYKQ